MKDTKTITTAIDKIKTHGAKLDSMVQAAAVDVLEHFQTHRDTGLVNRLFLALPKGSRSVALADWLLKFVAVKVNTNKETKGEQPFVFDKDKVPAMMAEGNLARATSTLWTDLKKEKAIDEVFDLQAGVRSLIRQIERHAKVERFDRKALVGLAVAVGIPESDVPTQPGGKMKKAPADVPAAAM